MDDVDMAAHALRPLLIVIAGLALLLPATTSAQSFDINAVDPFTLSTSPQNPLPYGVLTLSALSTSLNLANAVMVVSVSGKEVYRGNVQPVNIPLLGAGVLVTAKVTISVAGAKYSKTVSVRPQDVVLVAEPVSSAPALYPGKPLVPLGGSVRIVAVANMKDARGKALDPSTLSYAWAVDGSSAASISGIGKDAIIVSAPLQYRSRDVSVVVENQSGALAGGASLSLTAADPTVRLYENDPLLGILFDQALSGSYAIKGAEAPLYAAPFSFPTSSGAPLIEWFLNGATVQTGNSITLRPTGTGAGTASLSLVASSGDFAKAVAQLSLSFGGSSGANPSGL
ncbi:hypothetical protein KGQ25_02905 [Patescibacteria group bacterium]|nr:hypothetical protein [Patescibacteria group bacterium]MDE2021680.1 hypothetical protein [Patescibacteria group bacterium]MDE2173603.1 hypothetical protein [Patescibacteria group bacterium]